MQRKIYQEKKILVELLHGIGDIVCAVPMLRALRKRFPLARIDVVVKFQTCADVRQCADVRLDNCYVLNVYSGVGSIYKFAKKCRKTGYDIGIAAPHTSVSKAYFFMEVMAKVHKWFGVQKNGLFFDTLPKDCHHVKSYSLAVEGLLGNGVAIEEPRLFPELNKGKIRKIECYNVEDLVGVCIGNADYTYSYPLLRLGKVYAKEWGIENMRDLIKKVLSLNMHVVLLGGKQEEQLLPVLRDVLGSDKVLNMVGKTNIVESMMLAKKCKCVVGVDTGMMHIAAAVGTSTVSIFGCTSPYKHSVYASNAASVFHPEYCEKSPCYGSKMYVKCTDRKCLKKISVDEVCKLVNQTISEC